jgi:pimeloyl-ACP methyl ester carboxylesterase
MIHTTWGQRLREVFESIDDPQWDGAEADHPLLAPSEALRADAQDRRPRRKDHLNAMNGTLVFSHGNSFPAGTYRQLLDLWAEAGLTVRAVPMFGHDPAYPVASNWRGLRDQLIHFIEAQQAGEPVWLVGHSLGGLLSLMAACRRPDLARGLVMLDSPVITGWRAQSVAVFKRSGLIRRSRPARCRSSGATWPDLASVKQHFASKPVFARWDPRVLDDYVAAGFVEAPQGGVQLRFSREVETRIYNTLPDHLGALLRATRRAARWASSPAPSRPRCARAARPPRARPSTASSASRARTSTRWSARRTRPAGAGPAGRHGVKCCLPARSGGPI